MTKKALIENKELKDLLGDFMEIRMVDPDPDFHVQLGRWIVRARELLEKVGRL